MLFNSPEFIYLFLPVTLIVYFILNKYTRSQYAKIWLLFSSLFFYSYWNPIYLLVILASMLVNFKVGKALNKTFTPGKRRFILYAGVIFNLSLLIFFKYTDFIIANYNLISADSLPLLNIVLPLGISFFTFQQIAYVVDSYKGLTGEYNFFNFGLFVTFFPQLIAGPIVHHSEMMPQFYSDKNNLVNYHNLSKGIYVFFMGLAKKVILADSFAVYANQGYSNTTSLSFLDGWITSLAYSFQLYFDFSGYSDMAIGIAFMFNIKLPYNFNSPYKASDIQDFWRRWHITLSRFLRDYIYIPLGGSRVNEGRILLNLMITFLLGGIWHGAGWTFLFWGFLHGFALVTHRIWSKHFKLPHWLGIFITFNFANIAWIFFRAKTWTDAINMLKAMFLINDHFNTTISVITDFFILPFCFIGIILLFGKNTNTRMEEFKLDKKHLILTLLLIVIGLIFINSITANDFLYFDF